MPETQPQLRHGRMDRRLAVGAHRCYSSRCRCAVLASPPALQPTTLATLPTVAQGPVTYGVALDRIHHIRVARNPGAGQDMATSSQSCGKNFPPLSRLRFSARPGGLSGGSKNDNGGGCQASPPAGASGSTCTVPEVPALSLQCRGTASLITAAARAPGSNSIPPSLLEFPGALAPFSAVTR